MRRTNDYMTPDEREQRLVSWAKQTIDGLRNRVVELEDAVAATSSKHVGTCVAEVFVEQTQRSDRPFGRLIVNLSNGSINVVPSASNQIYIDSRRF